MSKMSKLLRMYAIAKSKSLSELSRARDKTAKAVTKLHISLHNEARVIHPKAKEHVIQSYIQKHPRFKELKRLRRAHLKAANEYVMGAIMNIKRK